MEEQELLQEEEAERLAKNRRIRKTLGIIGVILAILAFLGWWMIGEMIGYTAGSKYESLCSSAKLVYQAAMQWEEDGNTITVYSGKLDGSEADPPWIQRYMSNTKGYYALVQDEDGSIRYSLYSFKPIDESCLQSPPDPQEQRKLLKSHFSFRRDKVVGVYAPEKTPSSD